MPQNIVNSLKQRETNFRLDPEKFVAANYFNESMINRLRVEKKVSLEFETSDDLVSCGSWNCDGTLLACGKKGKGVQIYAPFRNYEKVTAVDIKDNHTLADVVFIPRNKNLMTFASRRNNTLFFWSNSGLVRDDYVKIWDVEKNVAFRQYSFTGVVAKLVTCPTLPNHLWFNTDNKVQTVAEVDIRAPGYKTISFGPVNTDDWLVYRRCFDVNPVDEVTIAVGDKNKLLFYDRRTVTSQKAAQPARSVDVSALNGTNSYILQVAYSPKINKMVLINSHSFTCDCYVLPSSRPEVRDARKLTFSDNAATLSVMRSPSFFGSKYAIFDTFLRNYSAVFDVERARLVGRITLDHQSNIFSNVVSMPHPRYCLIAATNQDLINFVSPTGSDQNDDFDLD